MKIKCRVEGCLSSIEVSNATQNTKYMCSKHPSVSKDDIHFQEAQFDKELNNSFTPQGTNHIRHQGSESWKSEETSLALSKSGMREIDAE